MASFPGCESTWQLVYYNFIVFSLPGLICARAACLPLLPDLPEVFRRAHAHTCDRPRRFSPVLSCREENLVDRVPRRQPCDFQAPPPAVLFDRVKTTYVKRERERERRKEITRPARITSRLFFSTPVKSVSIRSTMHARIVFPLHRVCPPFLPPLFPLRSLAFTHHVTV